MNSKSDFQRVYLAPVLLAVLTAGGLTLALLGDNLWDALSWLALATPLATVIWIFLRARRVT
ncbi:MAG TPA: hypothetical protein VFQ83_01655 [Candidatus Udaeobacter sp.]|jgi:hypothetical protein|nr:hypothetical protein [Candidatus Udaeobacter sp.]